MQSTGFISHTCLQQANEYCVLLVRTPHMWYLVPHMHASGHVRASSYIGCASLEGPVPTWCSATDIRLHLVARVQAQSIKGHAFSLAATPATVAAEPKHKQVLATPVSSTHTATDLSSRQPCRALSKRAARSQGRLPQLLQVDVIVGQVQVGVLRRRLERHRSRHVERQRRQLTCAQAVGTVEG